jgi:hypothetical protein
MGRQRGGGFGQDLYTGTRAYGKFVGIVGGATGLLVGVILLGIGLYLVFRKTQYTGRTTATVTSAACSPEVGNTAGTTSIVCDIKIQYTVAGNSYQRDWRSTGLSQNIVPGSSVSLRYDPANPQDIIVNTISGSMVGLILIGVSLLLLIGAASQIYAVTQYDVAAVATGAGSAAGIVGDYLWNK